jgi:hypothetical protein
LGAAFRIIGQNYFQWKYYRRWKQLGMKWIDFSSLLTWKSKSCAVEVCTVAFHFVFGFIKGNSVKLGMNIWSVDMDFRWWGGKVCLWCLAHSVLSLEIPQSFHKVNFILLFVTKTCVYQKPGYFFLNVWDMQWISHGLWKISLVLYKLY